MAKQYHRNPRQITKKKYERLTDTMTRLGDLSGIVHNQRTDEIIGGNQRDRVIKLDDCEIVIFKRYDEPDFQGTVAVGFAVWKGAYYNYRLVDWDEPTSAEANLAANIGAGDWDFEVFANQWETEEMAEWFNVDLLGDWRRDVGALDAFLSSQEEEPVSGDAEPQTNRADELREEWGTAVGQMWRMESRTPGQFHLLIVGDCTDAAVVDRVMGGERADMVFTDPPYGIAYSSERWANLGPQSQGLSAKRNNAPMIDGDDGPFDPSFLLSIFAGVAEIFVWGFQYYPDKLGRGGVIVWNKKTESQADCAHGDFELCWSKVERNRMCWLTWGGFKNKEAGENRLHTTQKPVALPEWFFRNWGSEGDIVADPFAGSGTTMIASENLQRQARLVEISPSYCAVILQRYFDAFGIRGELVD